MQKNPSFYPSAPNSYSQLYEGPLAQSFINGPPQQPNSMFTNARMGLLGQQLFKPDPRTVYSDKDYTLPTGGGSGSAPPPAPSSGSIGGVPAPAPTPQPISAPTPAAPVTPAAAPYMPIQPGSPEERAIMAPALAEAALTQWRLSPEGRSFVGDRTLKEIEILAANGHPNPTYLAQGTGGPGAAAMAQFNTALAGAPPTTTTSSGQLPAMPNFQPPTDTPAITSASRTMYSTNFEPNPSGVTRQKKGAFI